MYRKVIQLYTQTHIHIHAHMGFPTDTVVKNLPANAGDAIDVGLIPGLGGCPGLGNGNPLQCSCIENSTDRGSWWAIVHGGHKKSDLIEQLNTHICIYIYSFFLNLFQYRLL